MTTPPRRPPSLPHLSALLILLAPALALAERPSATHASAAVERASPAHASAAAILAPATSGSAAAATSDPRDGVALALRYTVTIEGDGVYGSGIVIAPAAGLVLTALHVVENVRTPRVTFVDGRAMPAEVIDSDKVLDVALLRIAPQPQLVGPKLGDALALRPAEEVYAVGCPRRLGFTVSRGIVSYVGREMDGARYIQTDLPINDGNSGGPVVNARGELVGMMSFILRHSQGLAFALPVNYAAARFKKIPPPPNGAEYFERFRRWSAPATIQPAP